MTDAALLPRALAVHRVYVRIALSLHVFAWIATYLAQLSITADPIDSFVRTLFLYALAQVSAILIMPYAGRLLRSGIRRTMVIGVLAASLAFALLSALIYAGPGEYAKVWVVFALLIGAHRALYHVPYALERAALGTPHRVLTYLMCAVPIGFGWGMTYAPEITCAFASAVLLGSLVPLVRIPETYERYSWGYRETFSKLFEPRFALFIDKGLTRGIEAAALHLVWPFAVYFILGQSYLWLGFVLAFTMLFSVLMRAYLPISFFSFSPALHRLAMGSTWLVRLVVATPAGILFANWYTLIVSPQHEVGSDEPAENATFIDEFSALKEMASAAGRLALSLITALGVIAMDVPSAVIVSFLIAALAAMYSGRLTRAQ